MYVSLQVPQNIQVAPREREGGGGEEYNIRLSEDRDDESSENAANALRVLACDPHEFVHTSSMRM